MKWVQLEYETGGHKFIVASGPDRKWYLWFLYSENHYPNGSPAPEGGWWCVPNDFHRALEYGKCLLEQLCSQYCEQVAKERNLRYD